MKKKYEEYEKEIIEIFRKFEEEMAEYMYTLPKNYLLSKDYRVIIPSCFLINFKHLVGEESLLHFLIELLHNASLKDAGDKMLEKQQTDRFYRIRKENKEDELK